MPPSYFKETFDFLMDSRYTTESLRKYVGNIGSVLKELSLSKNSDHAYKAKEALDSKFLCVSKLIISYPANIILDKIL
jgi:hypothetical protein